jgi:AraC-like DNA-binding protein
VRGACDATPRFRLTTLATPRERQQIDAAAVDCVRATHRNSLAEVAKDFASASAEGAVISTRNITAESVSSVAGLVRGFPTRTVVGLIGETTDADAIAAALLFGRAGIQDIADIRNAQGWRAFRNVFNCANEPDAFMREALGRVLESIESTERSAGLTKFFRLVFSPSVTSAKEVAVKLGVLPSTLMSRFFRAGLPSPKRYVAAARLVWAAYLGESNAMSVAAIANRLSASSPQSFHRSVRTLMKMSATEFRHEFTGAQMLEVFQSELITPHRAKLIGFDPLTDFFGINAQRRSLCEGIAAHSTSGRAA